MRAVQAKRFRRVARHMTVGEKAIDYHIIERPAQPVQLPWGAVFVRNRNQTVLHPDCTRSVYRTLKRARFAPLF